MKNAIRSRIGHPALTLAWMLGVSVIYSPSAAFPQEPGSGEAHEHKTPGNEHQGQGMHHDFSDVASFASRFEGPERRAWQKPEHVISLLAIEPGMTVVDIGAGTGFFAPYLAAAVGAGGRVLALDVEPNMVKHIEQRVEDEGLSSVEPKLIPYDDPQLMAGSVDRILIVDTWHHIDDRGAYSRKLLEALRPGGRVYVVDFTEESPVGPPRRHRLRSEQVAEELSAGGLEVSQLEEELPNQYVVMGRR